MASYIIGIGTAVPAAKISQGDAAQIAATLTHLQGKARRVLPELYRRSGVDSRHSVLLDPNHDVGESVLDRQQFYPASRAADEQGPTTQQRMTQYELHATPLASRACRAALIEADLDPSTITHLITVSCTGFSAPGVDINLIDALALSPSVARTHIGFMGCHAMLNAMRVADALAASDHEARVLVCAVELCSLHQQYGWESDRIVANSLFADGAAAMVVTNSSETECEQAVQIARNGSVVLPNSRSLMSWNIGNNGFEMKLSPEVPERIKTALAPWLEDWLASQGCKLEEIDHWIVHPGGPRILDAVESALGLSKEALAGSREILRQFGNMSSPTVIFALQRMRKSSARGTCLQLAFGPGLTVEAAMLQISSCKILQGHATSCTASGV